MRIHCHDGVCDVVWHALLQDHNGCKKEQRCSGDFDRTGDVFIRISSLVSRPILMFLCVTLCRLCLSATTAGVAAGRDETDKDSHHQDAVQAAGVFCSFCGGDLSLSLWSPNSLAVLRSIALRAIIKSGASSTLAFCYFIEHLSVFLWRYNSRMLLHHLSLLPGSPLWEGDD